MLFRSAVGRATEAPATCRDDLVLPLDDVVRAVDDQLLVDAVEVRDRTRELVSIIKSAPKPRIEA